MGVSMFDYRFEKELEDINEILTIELMRFFKVHLKNIHELMGILSKRKKNDEYLIMLFFILNQREERKKYLICSFSSSLE